LHWREDIPISESVEAFTALHRSGKILDWGVSNFDIRDMEELISVTGGAAVATNQVMYNLRRRGIEHSLLRWCRRRRIPIMAYSPLDEGRLLRSRTMQRIALQHRATPAQVAIAWLLLQREVIIIPKMGNEAHVRENRRALDLRLSRDDLSALDAVLPAPKRKRPLEMT
jgi:diketogulonate reductase-like aldo/keto reductase